MEFGKLFESQFLNQGMDTNRDILETLDLGWDLLSMLPKQELDRIDSEILDQNYNRERSMKRFKIAERSIIRELAMDGE